MKSLCQIRTSIRIILMLYHFPISYQMDSWLRLVCQRPGDHQRHICSQLAHGTCTSVHPSGWGPCVMYRWLHRVPFPSSLSPHRTSQQCNLNSNKTILLLLFGFIYQNNRNILITSIWTKITFTQTIQSFKSVSKAIWW